MMNVFNKMTDAENIRAGAPYDDPAFERLAREHDIWGRADSALCAVFWLAGKVQPPSGQIAAPTGAIYDAIDILTTVADDLRECHTLASAPDDWAGEDEAKAEYDRILRCVAALRAQLAAATPDEIEGLRAHVALLKSALAQSERENDELRRAQPAAATVTTDAQAIRDAALEEDAAAVEQHETEK